jgi:dienelactone hydrolase
MTRREWLLLSVACGVRSKLTAASEDGFYYRDYAKCLPDYLSGIARTAYERRNREISLLTNQEAIQKRQSWARSTFWKLVGGEPERNPLNARITGKLERSGYNLEKVVYESQPGTFVTANLYIPTSGKPPYPGVLFQMGHTEDGKAASSYQKGCQGLALLGYLVLGFDPMGQGERVNYPDGSGLRTRLSRVSDEHSVPGKQLVLLGETVARYQTWDAIRSLDYLASHPLVDPERLASVGQSGGGTLTMLLACADERLRAAAVCSGNTENMACANFDPPGSPADAEQDFIGSGSVGFDRWDLLYPFAPKPLLILVSAHDFFGTYSPRYLSSGLEEYEKLAKIYEVLGRRDRIAWQATALPHSLSYGLRLDVYNWFERWLKNSSARIEKEPPVSPEPEKALWAGPTGSVVRDFGSLRPFDLLTRKAQGPRRTESTAPWADALQIRRPSSELKLRTLASTPSGENQIRAVEVLSAPEVWIPAWFYVPGKPEATRAALLVLDEDGRNTHIREGDVYDQLTHAGSVICVADIRGIGDSKPEVGRGNPGFTIPHESEEQFAWGSLILGNSLLAQRVVDILALVQAMKNDTAAGSGRLAIAARGRLTVPALFAFAASRLVDSLYLAGGLISYQNLLETESYQQPLASFAWDVFQRIDLPQLAAQAAPRLIHLAGTVDASGRQMDPAVVRTVYSTANIRISEGPSWDATVLGLI